MKIRIHYYINVFILYVLFEFNKNINFIFISIVLIEIVNN